MFIEENTYHGQWWLPERPDKKVHGELQVTKSGHCSLKIFLTEDYPISEFFETHRAFNEDFSLPRFIGHLYSGEIVTLENFTCVLRCITNSTYQFSCYPSFICFSSINFETDEIKVDELYLDIDGLKYFIDKSGMNFSHIPLINAGDKYEGYYERQPIFKLFENEEMTAKAFLGHEISYPQQNLSIKETASIILTYKNPRSIEEWKKDIISLNYFICTIFGQPLPLTSIRARMEGDQFNEKLNFKFYTEPHQQIKRVRWRDLLFKYSDDDKNTGKILYEFIKLRRKYSLIFESFFSSQFTDEQYTAVRFFMIARALESFHRQFQCNNNKEKKDPTFRERIKNLFQCNNNKEKKDPTFKERMENLFKEFDKISDQQHEWGELASDTTKYRNQEAHISKLERNRTDMEKMMRITIILQAVFAVLFLNEAAKRCNFTIPPKWINERNWLTRRLPKSKNTPEDAS